MFKTLLLAASVALLSACGGGGDADPLDEIPIGCITSTHGSGVDLLTSKTCSTVVNSRTKRICVYTQDYRGVNIHAPSCSDITVG